MSDRPIADPDIRAVLKSRLQIKHALETDTVVVEELGLCQGQVRVDMAVVNGVLHGYEIKSDCDTLRRLPNQVVAYGKVLDRATLVVGVRHLEEALEQVPVWWGVMKAEATAKGLCLKVVRPGRKNPSRDPRVLAELLWRDEALALLKERDAVRGLLTKPRQHAWDRVAEVYDVNEIGDAVRARLKARAMPPVLPQPG